MLRVRDAMTRDVVTLGTEASAGRSSGALPAVRYPAFAGGG